MLIFYTCTRASCGARNKQKRDQRFTIFQGFFSCTRICHQLLTLAHLTVPRSNTASMLMTANTTHRTRIYTTSGIPIFVHYNVIFRPWRTATYCIHTRCTRKIKFSDCRHSRVRNFAGHRRIP